MKKKGNHLAETEEMSYEGVEYFDSSTLVANAIHLWLFCLIAFSSLIPITSPKVLFPAFSSCMKRWIQAGTAYLIHFRCLVCVHLVLRFS